MFFVVCFFRYRDYLKNIDIFENKIVKQKQNKNIIFFWKIWRLLKQYWYYWKTTKTKKTQKKTSQADCVSRALWSSSKRPFQSTYDTTMVSNRLAPLSLGSSPLGSWDQRTRPEDEPRGDEPSDEEPSDWRPFYRRN